MPDLHETLAAKNVTFLDRAGPKRVIGQRRDELVALTSDGQEELWRHPLPGEKEGFVVADDHTVLWNARGDRRFVAMAAADGRQLYAIDGEWAVWLDGDRFLSRNAAGSGMLRLAKNGNVIFSLSGLSPDVGYTMSSDHRLLINGCSPAQVWDLEEQKLRFSFDTSSTADYEFTPDGKLVVKTIMTPQSGMQDEVTVCTYDLRSGMLDKQESWWERQ